MEENTADVLLKTSSVLHWLGKYTEANTCILLSRLLRAKKISTLEELQAHVTTEEACASKDVAR